MKITYHGNTSFFIKGKKTSIALDPIAGMPKSSLALFSSDTHEDTETDQTIDWPGEYEAAEVLVHAIAASYGEAETTLFQFEVDDVKFLYFPNLDHVLGEGDLEKIGEADVILLPVGGGGVLDAKTAAKVYESIEPKIVIPMQHSQGHFGPVGDFLKEVGKIGLEFEDSISVEKSTLPVDNTEFHVLSAV